MRARRPLAACAGAAACAAAACAAAAAACATSPEPHRAAVADRHYGAVGELHLRDGRRHRGELLEVGDSTLAMMAVLDGARRVVVARLPDVDDVNWPGFRSYPWTPHVRRSADLRARGRLASRFPYGMPPAALAALLAAAGQTAPDTLRAEAR